MFDFSRRIASRRIADEQPRDLSAPVLDPAPVQGQMEAQARAQAQASSAAPAAAPRLSGENVLRWLLRGSAVIVLGAVLALAAAVVTLGLVTPRYASSVQILVSPSDLRLVDNDINQHQPQADSGVSMAESQVRVIQSDNVLRRVVAKLHLDRDDEFVPPEADKARFAWLKAALGLQSPQLDGDRADIALDSLKSKVTVRRAERTFVIDVIVQSRDPVKAAAIANAIGEAYLADDLAARREVARRASEGLSDRLDDLRRDVEQAEQRVVLYREANHMVSSDGRLLIDRQVGDLNQQSVTAAIKLADAKARLDQARAIRFADANTALPEMLQSRDLQNLLQDYATASRKTAELAMRLGARHPDMADQYAQQRDLQRLIQREKERVIDAMQKDYDRAAANAAAVQKNLDLVKNEVASSDRADVGLHELERAADARKAVYEEYLKRSHETSAQEQLNATNIRIISAATPARQRSFPPSPKVVLPAALILGLTLGAGLAVLLGMRADRRRTDRSGGVPLFVGGQQLHVQA